MSVQRNDKKKGKQNKKLQPPKKPHQTKKPLSLDV